MSDEVSYIIYTDEKSIVKKQMDEKVIQQILQQQK